MARSGKKAYFSIACVVLVCVGIGIIFGLRWGFGTFALAMGIGCGLTAIDADKEKDEP